MGPIVGIQELVSMLLRRGPVIAAVFVVGVLASLYQALSQPHSYEAITVIQLEPSMINGAAAGSAAAVSETAGRLRLIEQRLMSRSNVLDMIDRFEMFDGAAGMPTNEKIGLFRESVSVDFVPSMPGAPGGMSGISALILTVQADQPSTAADLANDMASQILEGDRETRAARLQDLIEALQDEGDRMDASIAASEGAAERFRDQNTDSLPSNIELLATERARLQDQRVTLARSRQSLERERLALQVADDTENEGTTVLQQLRKLEVDLAQARRSLPDDHPEVRRLSTAIEELRAGQYETTSPGVLQQIRLIDEQEAALQGEGTDIDRRLVEIDTAIAAMPQVAAQLEEFDRRRELLSAQRQAVAERLNAAQLDAQLIANDHGERMIVLERAATPELPISSGRKRTAALGLAVSIFMALMAGFALEMANPVMRTSRQVERALGVAPIAVSRFRPTAAQLAANRTRNLQALSILGTGAIAGVMLILLQG
ncbi:hypothetical protein [Paracoccus sp. PARArs4]|uniref:GumC family protein n=1 Tax=Paracoccus sp. PARArs4 TaxID=2853442 RepID=UPI0024A72718|nr:hypothetical protein [Paracoccus sp. PARArs4]